MIYHVLPGDATAGVFKKTDIAGELIVFREALIAGDVSAEDLDQFWEHRANFLAVEYGEDPIQYQESVAYELEKLLQLTSEDEVNLWFEYELFCQANMWFCLDLLKHFEGPVYRVEPLHPAPDEIWDGFGKHDAEDLEECLRNRISFTDEDRELGSKLWAAFRRRDAEALRRLGESRSPCFPFLKEVTEAAAEIDHRPAAVVREIEDSGLTGIENIFPEFRRRAGVYGFGDLQVSRLLDPSR